MSKFIRASFLPNSAVTDVVVSDFSPLKLFLNKMGINTLTTLENQALEPYVADHADTLFYHLGSGQVIVDRSQSNLINDLTNHGCSIIKLSKSFSPYPNDCIINCCDIGDYLICNRKITDSTITDYALYSEKNILNVKQGYCKCSICVVGRNKIITDDASIYGTVKNNKAISALLVKKGSIYLNNCDYGFIGGCSGLIDKNLVLFNGDLSQHSSYKEIIDFLSYHNIQYIDIKGYPLTDIGSIIPLKEEE